MEEPHNAVAHPSALAVVEIGPDAISKEPDEESKSSDEETVLLVTRALDDAFDGLAVVVAIVRYSASAGCWAVAARLTPTTAIREAHWPIVGN